MFTWALLQVSVTLASDAFPADEGTLIFNVDPPTSKSWLRVCHFSGCGHPFRDSPRRLKAPAPRSPPPREAVLRQFAAAESRLPHRRAGCPFLSAHDRRKHVGSKLHQLAEDGNRLRHQASSISICNFRRRRNIQPPASLLLCMSFARAWPPCREWLQSPALGRQVITSFKPPPRRSMERNPRRKMCS